MTRRDDVREALERLDKRRLVLAIHDACFPSAPGEDTGRGSPYTRGGRAFVRFAHDLGFDAIQLGPQGQTSLVNRSPYDGTLFSRSELSIDLHALADDPEWAGLLTRDEVEAVVAGHPAPGETRVQHRYAVAAYEEAVDRAYARFVDRRAADAASARAIDEALGTFRAAHAAWLERDALYSVLEAMQGGRWWGDWSPLGQARHDAVLFRPPPGAEETCERRRRELLASHEQAIERHAFGQLVVHRQHASLREVTASLGLPLFGDVQVGISVRDAWAWASLLMGDYRMGAPPSRTNPEGQPWGYGVLDPSQYETPDGQPGPAKRFMRRRLAKMLAEFDGLRVDHPHGFICPWVYRADDPDPVHSVQHGTRLFSSPDLAEPERAAGRPSLLAMAELARFAIPRQSQLARDPTTPRYAEGWVERLDPEQVARYAALFEIFVDEAAARGGEIICEVLSTMPYPLRRVMASYGLGRFRVTQKAALDDPDDVYRSENARPEDWVMVGTHDTPPVWHLARRQWHGTAEGARQAAYLAARLAPGGGAEALERRLRADPDALVQAKMADVLASPARQVMIFFSDLLGIEAIYNRPGTVSDRNWSLRVPNDYAETYEARRRLGQALDLPRVLAMALRARGLADPCAGLIARLEGGRG